MERLINYTLADDKAIENLGFCFTSSLRRKIIKLISEKSYSITDLSERFNVPISTMSNNIKILADAGLILLTPTPKKRGREKIVSLSAALVRIDIGCQTRKNVKTLKFDVPIGSYSDFKVKMPCGMANENGIILENDVENSFYAPDRIYAQLIWFTKGYLEYKIPLSALRNKTVFNVRVSLELCSECPNFRNDWKSDVTFWINGCEAATYRSPGDFGGRRGALNPQYWSASSTQYGLLKSLKINDDGCFIDETKVGEKKLSDFRVGDNDTMSFRVGVKDNAEYAGGINIFGEKFGDYPQNIMIMIEYAD